MKLYNTLTKRVDAFKPLEGNRALVYSCGPTVYDHAHIGNLSAYIFADTLHRALLLDDYTVNHVMNYTDVDDKTIRRSAETYPQLEPRNALRKLTDTYIGLFHSDMQAVGNDIGWLDFKRATDTIAEMQQLIAELFSAGFAYIADDGVYFSIAAYRKSGKKYGQLLEITTADTSQQRIQNDEYDKASAHDFALWKRQKDHEPAWDFTLDGKDLAGRPGWHIECSAMSRAGLGQPFDIHTGGIDLIFPHHENEIAQSTAGQENNMMAAVFAHNNHILVDGKKMAKSAQNFYTLQDITDKGYDPLAFRLLVLQSHYRSQLNFSWESMDAAQNRLNDLRALAALQWQPFPVVHDATTMIVEDVIIELSAALRNDIDTPQALAYLSDVSKQLQTILIDAPMVQRIQSMLSDVDRALGLNLADEPDITIPQKQLIAERETARAAKDWAGSDKLRDQLSLQGIGLRDTSYGPVWYRQGGKPSAS